MTKESRKRKQGELYKFLVEKECPGLTTIMGIHLERLSDDGRWVTHIVRMGMRQAETVTQLARLRWTAISKR